jgi:predicted RNA-binding protein associated with RNAse of E/G family
MPPKRVRIHYHRPGRGTVVFHEDLLIDRPDVKVTLLREYQGKAVHAGAERILDPGAPVVWFVFPDLWRDVGRFHLSDGTFTGWYTNLRSPPVFDGNDWHLSDLFLDYWAPASGGHGSWLDEDEFEDARRNSLVTPDELQRVAAERREVDKLASERTWPPLLTQDLTLQKALLMAR